MSSRKSCTSGGANAPPADAVPGPRRDRGLRATAKRYGLKTLSDLKKVPDLTIAGFPEWETRWTGPIGTQYGVKGFDFVPLAGISAYTLLDQGDVGRGRVHDGSAAPLEKYVQLRDPKNMFGFQHVARSWTVTSCRRTGRTSRRRSTRSARLYRQGHAGDEQGRGVNKKPAAKVADPFLRRTASSSHREFVRRGAPARCGGRDGLVTAIRLGQATLSNSSA